MSLSTMPTSKQITHEDEVLYDVLKKYLTKDVVVTNGSDLYTQMTTLNDGDTVYVMGDVTLNQSITIPNGVNIKSLNGGRILWNGPTNNCVRYVLPVKNTITDGVQFLPYANTATLPAGHGVVVGDCLEAHSNSIRFTDSSNRSYTRGQLFFVESVNGNTVTFTPNVIEGFTSSEIIVTKTLHNMEFDVEIKTIKPSTGTATGVLLDIHNARGLRGRFRITGNEDESYGLAVTGHNNHFNVDVWGITAGAGSVNVPGYGVNVVGTDMHVTGTGGKCRHVYEAPAGNVISANLTFDMHVIKLDSNPQFLYAAGVHANVVGWKARGSISGSGYLLADRSGTGDISVDFFGKDSGYDYADVYIADIPPQTTKIHNCTSYGSLSRRTLVDYDCNGKSSNNGVLKIDGVTLNGPKRILRLRDSTSSPSPVYRAVICNCVGEAVSFTNRDLAGANVSLSIYDNKVGSYGIPVTFNEYMLGVDGSGCNSYELHFHNNIIDDTLPNGVLRIEGPVGSLNIDSSHCSNGAKSLYSIAPTALGSLNGLSVDHASTSGQMQFNLPVSTTFNTIANVSMCNIKFDSTQPIASTLIPIVYTGNSFKTSFDATLVSTKRPQAGNVNLTGKSINWNGTNIAI